MTNNGIVKIQGKEYMTVARRLELAQAEKALEGVETDVLSFDPVVIRAKVTLKGKVYTGISSISLDSPKYIERQNPYEVAETSAVGRALGFAGFGLIESVASADEMVRAISKRADEGSQTSRDAASAKQAQLDEEGNQVTCEVCGKTAVEKRGITKAGKAYHGVFCESDDRSHTRWLWN
jgi:hypothetical protein